jgi:DNA-binding NarL/FixJ family response regulator
MTAVRVLIADDHPVFRDGLRALLESADFEVVGEVGTGDDAVRLATEAQPDVVLMDLHMPGGGGVAATERIVRQGAAPCLPGRRGGRPPGRVVSMFAAHPGVHGAIRAGASGYVLKDAHQDALLRAIRSVAAGEAVFGAGVAPKVLAHLAAGERHGALAFPQLTARELDVVDLVARGENNPAIARRLKLSDKTVRNMLSNILVKLHASDRAEAIVMAREAGLGRREGRPDEYPAESPG